MMIDDTQTPAGEETVMPENPGAASDTAPVAPATTDQPQDLGNQPESPQASAIDPEAPTPPQPSPAPTDPQPDTPATPVEPTVPTPGDPTPPAAPPQPPAPSPAPSAPATPQAQAEESANRADDMALFDSYMNAMESGADDGDASFKKLSKGDRIEATIIQVDKDRVFVDLGTKAEGVVPLNELTDDNIESAHDHFNVGDKINVVVLRPEGGAEGNALVSKKRADFEEAWDRIEEAHRTQEMITAQVVDRVKGGLVVDVGVRGFVPATHVGSGKLRNIEKYVGQPLQLKVIEIDRDRKKVVLSNRDAEKERREAAKDNIFQNVKPGDELEGTVRRLTDYGAFVDLGGVDGLLHISEMSWMRINHPKEMFKEGQKIKVMVLRLDQNTGKISLGHRQVLPDPWNLIKENYKIGQTLTVKVSRLVQNGAFIKLPEGAEAFMPVSEMSSRRIKRPEDVVEEGQDVEAQVIDLRPDERRMVLSMRAIGGGATFGRESGAPPSYEDEMRGDKRGKPGKKGGRKGRGGRDYEDDFEEVAAGRRGFATGGATIGERLGMLKGFLREDDESEEETSAAEGSDEEATQE